MSEWKFTAEIWSLEVREQETVEKEAVSLNGVLDSEAIRRVEDSLTLVARYRQGLALHSRTI
jgi:hypothetical protein